MAIAGDRATLSVVLTIKSNPDMVSTAAVRPKPKLWTKQGLAILGKYIRESREQQELSLADAAALVFQATGMPIAKKTIANIENNVSTRAPEYNTIAAIAAAGFVLNPVTQKPFNEDDFIDIACELLNPFSNYAFTNQGRNNMSTKKFIDLLKIQIGDQPPSQYATTVGLKPQEIELLLAGNSPSLEQIKKLAKHITNPDTGKKRDIEWLARLAGVWKELDENCNALPKINQEEHQQLS